MGFGTEVWVKDHNAQRSDSFSDLVSAEIEQGKTPIRQLALLPQKRQNLSTCISFSIQSSYMSLTLT